MVYKGFFVAGYLISHKDKIAPDHAWMNEEFGTRNYAIGGHYEGGLQNNQRFGYGVMTYSSGNLYEGVF